MSASLHPPTFTDWIANPALHASVEFWEKWNIAHSDMSNVLNTWLTMAIIIILALLVKNKLEMVPGSLQNFWEVVVGTVDDLVVETMGEQGRPYFPLIATLALFILVCNLIGIVPYLFSSTSNLNTTLALALIAFFTTHFVGIKMQNNRFRVHVAVSSP
ncbi:MAG: F0F1 ATP synthase subunit A [Rhodospirillales bacterium]|nr:F0F1 ATP synthase subunit A [Rhodospirillales bacterium]